MDIYELAGALFGRSRAENASVNLLRDTTIYGTAEKSADGLVRVYLGDDVTQAEDDGLEHDAYVELPTEVAVMDGDEVAVTLSGGSMSNARVTGVVGGGDRMQAEIDDAFDAADAARGLSEQAEAAARATSQHFWYDDSGAHVTQVTQDEWNDQTSTTTYHKGPNALWNALGMLFRNAENNLLSVLTNGIAIYDGAGNAAENILALITSNLVRIGGRFATSGQSSAGVQFFADDSSTSNLTASHYIDTDHDMQVYHNLMLDGTTTDQMLTGGTVTHSASGNLATYQEVYNDGTNWSEESHTGITAKTGDVRQIARMGVNAMRSSTGIQTRRAYIQADTLWFIHDTGGQTVVSDISMAQAIAGSRQPSVTYTGDNSTYTADVEDWIISWMPNTVGGSRADDYFTFSLGVITALRDCLLEISGVATWTSGPVGQYGFGIFIGSSTVKNGTEKSVFNYKASAEGQFSVTMPPVNIGMTTGMKIAVGRFGKKGSVYQNGYNFSWVTIKVIEDRSG